MNTQVLYTDDIFYLSCIYIRTARGLIEIIIYYLFLQLYDMKQYSNSGRNFQTFPIPILMLSFQFILKHL